MLVDKVKIMTRTKNTESASVFPVWQARQELARSF